MIIVDNEIKIKCDICGKLLKFDYEHPQDVDDALDAAMSEGWYVDTLKHCCINCYDYDRNNDTFTFKNNEGK